MDTDELGCSRQTAPAGAAAGRREVAARQQAWGVRRCSATHHHSGRAAAEALQGWNWSWQPPRGTAAGAPAPTRRPGRSPRLAPPCTPRAARGRCLHAQHTQCKLAHQPSRVQAQCAGAAARPARLAARSVVRMLSLVLKRVNSERARPRGQQGVVPGGIKCVLMAHPEAMKSWGPCPEACRRVQQ